MTRHGTIAATLAALLTCGPALAQEDTPTLLLSYETLPFDALGLDGDALDYAARVEITEAALGETVPGVLAAMDVAAEDVITLVMPGGYQMRTNASLQSSVEIDAATAEALAAALGYTFRQWSVLLTDFTPEGEGDTGYGVVSFEAPLTGAQAQAFFAQAAGTAVGLGGGYTAFDEEMFFLNATDSRGAPYSGLTDAQFRDALAEAAASYEGAEAELTRFDRADARFTENDWESAPDGQDYTAEMAPGTADRLRDLRAENDARVTRMGEALAAE